MGCLWAEVLLNLPWPHTWAGHWLAGVEPVLPFFPRHGSCQHCLQPGVSGPWLRTSTFLPLTWSWVDTDTGLGSIPLFCEVPRIWAPQTISQRMGDS